MYLILDAQFIPYQSIFNKELPSIMMFQVVSKKNFKRPIRWKKASKGIWVNSGRPEQTVSWSKNCPKIQDSLERTVIREELVPVYTVHVQAVSWLKSWNCPKSSIRELSSLGKSSVFIRDNIKKSLIACLRPLI